MNLIKLVKCEVTCNACPFQIEGEDDQGNYVYIRYRDGWLRAGRGKTENEFWNAEPFSYNIIDIQVGPRYDGQMSAELWEEMNKIFEFPDEISLSIMY